MNPSDAAVRAKELARVCGFALSGIAHVSAAADAPRADAFRSWLERGYHGPLLYMADSAAPRCRPGERFDWARSVLALGAFYDGATPEAGLRAHVARYARGRDYHLIFERRLKRLSRELAAAGVCARAHWYVDTGPVLERAWAEAAGLGWIGKNTCLIHPRLGSYLLLAEVFMDSAPQPDAPSTPHCGSCRRCLDACPTQALVAPGVLDSARCLVTWNLELRNRSPAENWPRQKEWIAGCDVCQVVCPYNAPDRDATPDAELAAPLPWQQLTLAECVLLDKARFDEAFAASALRRCGLNGLRLGAITVAANVRATDCREALARCADDPDVEIRARAAWALERLRGAD